MSGLKLTDSGKKKLELFLRPLQVQVASKLTAEFMDAVMERCPVEDGHAHECFMTAMDELSGELHSPEFNATSRRYQHTRSGDPEASAGATTLIGDNRDRFVVAISISLPFIRKLEYGGTIRVGDKSGNRGPKVDPVIRPPSRGSLYGARHSKGQISGVVLMGRRKLSSAEAVQIRAGVGLLVWMENGTIHRQLTRRPKAYAFWRNGKSAVRAYARQLKLKKR